MRSSISSITMRSMIYMGRVLKKATNCSISRLSRKTNLITWSTIWLQNLKRKSRIILSRVSRTTFLTKKNILSRLLLLKHCPWRLLLSSLSRWAATNLPRKIMLVLQSWVKEWNTLLLSVSLCARAQHLRVLRRRSSEGSCRVVVARSEKRLRSCWSGWGSKKVNVSESPYG